MTISQVIPARFWKDMPIEEFKAIVLNDGLLNAEQCARLWRMEDYQGDPPDQILVVVSRKDLERLFPRVQA